MPKTRLSLESNPLLNASVDMANGYGKAEGRPMCAMLHGTIGIQHASMSIYQAFYSGTPRLLIAGRDDGFIQAHTANDMAANAPAYFPTKRATK